MQLAASQLAAHLQRGLRSLYTLHGDEPLLIQEAADAIRAAAREQGFTERTVHTVAGAHFDWGEVLASGGSMSLFADKQLIEIRVPSGKPGKDGSQVLQQMAEAARDNDSTLTLVSLPRLDAATQKGAWFAALDSFGVTVKVDPVERQALPAWIAQRLHEDGDVHAGDAECGPAPKELRLGRGALHSGTHRVAVVLDHEATGGGASRGARAAERRRDPRGSRDAVRESVDRERDRGAGDRDAWRCRSAADDAWPHAPQPHAARRRNTGSETAYPGTAPKAVRPLPGPD